jgi:Protein of unknown function (DUF1778)
MFDFRDGTIASTDVLNCNDNFVPFKLSSYLLPEFLSLQFIAMKAKQPKRGAPKKPVSRSKGDHIQFRVNAAEKEAFEKAADLDGKKLSEWIRDRLRRDAKQELEEHGQPVPFIPTKPTDT